MGTEAVSGGRRDKKVKGGSDGGDRAQLEKHLGGRIGTIW